MKKKIALAVLVIITGGVAGLAWIAANYDEMDEQMRAELDDGYWTHQPRPALMAQAS